MPRELYQDIHPEVDSGECSGAGFFGSGDIVEPCGCCQGKGVLIDEDAMLYPRKPIRRATASETADVYYMGGE